MTALDILDTEQTTEMLNQTYGLFEAIFHGEWDKLLSRLPDHSSLEQIQFFDFLKELKETDLFELKVQYDNLFVAPGYYFVSPYRDSYVSVEEQQRTELAFLYEKAGLNSCEERLELADHIGCLLHYMQWLLYVEQKEWQKGNIEAAKQIRKAEKEFISKHLFWIPKLKQQVATKLEYGFLLNAVNALDVFIGWHNEELSK